ncbi:predicted protein [Nematostella vectensis]|uniref:Uncharacterized protein n=1 Tax=Nematostella vectensis TaxID=45351 RepID=A7RZR8_NEMVE|nr:predicted protein [Nematostella vectensis]|eukprot:XP_001635102.1 predicted protein [Nematostella vectensis]
MGVNNFSYVILFLAASFGSTAFTGQVDKDRELTNNLLDALNRVLTFYDHDHKTVNLDGVYGLRVAEGSLKKILEEFKGGKVFLSRRDFNSIRALWTRAGQISKRALPYLQKHNPAYFHRFKKQVSGPWLEFKAFRKLDVALIVPVNKRESIEFDEDTSDKCMEEMSGTGEIKVPCRLSDSCWRMMMFKGAGGYTLTHQALFLLLGETQGCRNKLDEKIKKSKSGTGLQQVYDRICASMYPQMVEFEKHPNSDGRDLYMEQAMVCGMMGYSRFLSKDRLKNILSWQNAKGCYGDDESNDDRDVYDISYDKGRIYGRIPQYEEISRRDIKHVASARKLLSMKTMRSLLVEKALEDGCMSHITGVATGLLGVYLRWLVHNAPQKQSTMFDGLSEAEQVRKSTNKEGPLFLRHIMGSHEQLAALAVVTWKVRKFSPHFRYFKKRGHTI